jgi:hypothetical protein
VVAGAGKKIGLILLVCGLWFSACTPTVPVGALRLEQESFMLRQLQTRRFSTTDEAYVLSSCAGVLQDTGFNLEESETGLGVIVASKERSAVDAGQVAGAIVLALLTGVAVATEKEQKFRASVVTRPFAGGTAVRVTFQRVVWNTQGQITRREALTDPEIYMEFFSKLSKSMFLEANLL